MCVFFVCFYGRSLIVPEVSDEANPFTQLFLFQNHAQAVVFGSFVLGTAFF